ncbi:MAG: hypothetical protein JSU94_09135 [Phycisphaerales bacterium]|nr:MAG: hypothetical protein JSU94_09135 [Phycisphaerales bacterium]
MKTSAKTGREKYLGVIALGVAIICVMFVVVIEPQLKQRKALLKRMYGLNLKLTKMQGDLLIKDRIDRIYAKLEPLIASSGTELRERVLLLTELRNMCSKAGVNPARQTLPPAENEDYYSRLSANIEIDGHVKDIVNFVITVEASPDPIRIESFNFNATNVEDNIHASFVISKIIATPKS